MKRRRNLKYLDEKKVLVAAEIGYLPKVDSSRLGKDLWVVGGTDGAEVFSDTKPWVNAQRINSDDPQYEERCLIWDALWDSDYRFGKVWEPINR